MGYWKKPGKYTCKKECKPYINLYGGTTTTAGVVNFSECGAECGFDQCRNDIIVENEGVYYIVYEGDDDLELRINNVFQDFGQTLFCLKCGDKIRVSGPSSTTGVSLTIFKVN